MAGNAGGGGTGDTCGMFVVDVAPMGVTSACFTEAGSLSAFFIKSAICHI